MVSKLMKLQYKVMFRMVNAHLYEYPILPELYEEYKERTIYERDADNHRRRKMIKESHAYHAALIIYGNGKKEVCAVTCDNEGDYLGTDSFSIHLTGKWRWWLSGKEKEEAKDEVIHATGLDDAFEQIEKLCDAEYHKCEYRNRKKRLEEKIKKLEGDISQYKENIREAKEALGGVWLYD